MNERSTNRFFVSGVESSTNGAHCVKTHQRDTIVNIMDQAKWQVLAERLRDHGSRLLGIRSS